MERRPLVNIEGTPHELPDGDTIAGTQTSSGSTARFIRFFAASGYLRPVLTRLTTFVKADSTETSLPML